MTDDQCVESHLTRVAKHMLWYPVLVIILPMASAWFLTFNGASVPFSVTICVAGLFMLYGFINIIPFCTTRNILPGSWRRRLGLGSAMDSVLPGITPASLPPRHYKGDCKSSQERNTCVSITGYSRLELEDHGRLESSAELVKPKQ